MDIFKQRIQDRELEIVKLKESITILHGEVQFLNDRIQSLHVFLKSWKKSIKRAKDDSYSRNHIDFMIAMKKSQEIYLKQWEDWKAARMKKLVELSVGKNLLQELLLYTDCKIYIVHKTYHNNLFFSSCRTCFQNDIHFQLHPNHLVGFYNFG